MIDAGIPLAVKPPQIDSPLQLLSQVGQIKQQQQNLQTGAIKQQGDQLALNQAGQSAQDQADYRAAMAAAVNPQTGAIDRGQLLSTLGKLNPIAAATTATNLRQQDTAAQEAQAKLTSAQSAAVTAHLDLKDKLLQGVSDQPTWTNARNIAIQNGISPNELPEQYDPQFVAQAHAQTLSQQQAFTQQQQQAELAEKKRNDDLEAQAKQNSIPPATKAIQIYAIPAAQRTPEQNAFITGYEKNNDLTKIAPAAVRVQALLQMPQAIVDPNDPSREIFTTKKAAVGQEAPGSGEAAGARKVLTSAIGGTLGNTINSYNTASAHLDMLSQAADALYNGNVRVLNQVGNAFNKETGNPAPTNFQAVKSAVAGEVSKTFKGGQATDAEIKQADDAINAANSPKQLQGVIQTYKNLMASKRDAIQQQVQQGVQGKPNFGANTAPRKFNPATGKIE